MKEITVPAKLEELDRVTEFINGELEACGCSAREQMQIDIAVEEIYVNIARYAYHPTVGTATVRCTVGGDPLQVTIQFQDEGRFYNPLEKKDPDLTLSAEERQIGGLGIYMVKKSMDDISYEYQNGKNILTIRKNLDKACNITGRGL